MNETAGDLEIDYRVGTNINAIMHRRIGRSSSALKDSIELIKSTYSQYKTERNVFKERRQ